MYGGSGEGGRGGRDEEVMDMLEWGGWAATGRLAIFCRRPSLDGCFPKPDDRRL